jgi:hypothetical protein
MSPNRALKVLAVGLAVISAAACDFSESRDDGEAFAERYFTAMQGDDVAGALALYSPKFFDGTPRDQWLATLRNLRERCGTPTSHALKNWMVTDQVGPASGSTTTLTYDVKYASCHLTETLVVSRPEGGEDKIIRHILKLEGTMPDKAGSAGTSV